MQKKLFRLVYEFPWLFLVSVVCAEIGAIFLILQYRQIAIFANLVMYQGKTIESLLVILIGIVIAVLIRGIFQFLSDISSRSLAVQIKSKIRRALIQKVTSISYSGRNQNESFQTLIVDGVEALDTYFSQYVPQILISIFIPLTILCFVFPLDILSGWVLLITAPLIPFFMILIGRFSKTVTSQQWSKLNRMSNFFLDSIRGVKTILLFNQGEQQVDRIKKVSNEYHDVTMKVLRVAFLSAFALEFISTLSTAVVAVEIGLRLLYGRLGFEEAFFILLIAPEFYLPLRNLGLRFHAGMNGVAAAKNIFSFLAQPDVQSKNEIMAGSVKLEDYKQIRFDSVTARYQNTETSILNSISFDIPIGKRTAIIGESGAGKSTIFQILLRFMDPEAGFVGLDDLALKKINIEYWRKQIGWIPQNPFLFNGTILENLKMGNHNATSTQIQAVLEKTYLTDFVNQLPFGMETKISDLGTQISAGQRQRIAIARVLLRDSQLLLFDELSASLDAIVEEKIQEILNNFSQRRTLVFIAHRLHTITSCDQILLLNEGKIEASGNHQQLLSKSDLYKKFLAAYFGVLI